MKSVLFLLSGVVRMFFPVLAAGALFAADEARAQNTYDVVFSYHTESELPSAFGILPAGGGNPLALLCHPNLGGCGSARATLIMVAPDPNEPTDIAFGIQLPANHVIQTVLGLNISELDPNFCDWISGDPSAGFAQCEVKVAAHLDVEVVIKPADGNDVPPRLTARHSATPADGSGGTIRAAAAGWEYNGDRVNQGATVTFTATPSDGWYVSGWSGDNDQCPLGNSSQTGAAGEQTCELPAAAELNVGAVFSQPGVTRQVEALFSYYPAGADFPDAVRIAELILTTILTNPEETDPENYAYVDAYVPGPATRTPSGFNTAQTTFAEGATIQFQLTTPENYAAASVAGAADYPECETNFHRATGARSCDVILEQNVSLAVFLRARPDCAELNRDSDSAAGDPFLCGGCLPNYEPRFGHSAAGDLGACFSATATTIADYVSAGEGLSHEEVCRALGGEIASDNRICSGMDAADTFCVLDSDSGLPCRGLLRHILRCNALERPALSAFLCGGECPGADYAPIGRRCCRTSDTDAEVNLLDRGECAEPETE